MQEAKAERLILIGLDGLNPELVERFVYRGKLPNFQRLMDQGVFTAALPSPPSDTPTNWATIATGAWTQTHGITSFAVHIPGDDLYDPLYGSANSNLCQAEFLCDAAEKVGKRSFVFEYPVSWPPTPERGIVMPPSTPSFRPGMMWAGMGNLGPAEAAERQVFGQRGYVWDQVQELEGSSIYPQRLEGLVQSHLGRHPHQSEDGAPPEERFLSYNENLATYFADAARLWKESEGWDLLFSHIHTIDSLDHAIQTATLEEHPDYSPEDAERAWNVYERAMITLDQMIGRLIRECADEQTIVAVVSDHGSLPCLKTVYVNNALRKAGLLVYQDHKGADGTYVDWSRTRVINSFNPTEFVWINLKGREPHGIVEPSDYEHIRELAIQALTGVRDPETGECPLACVLAREDAEHIGMRNERCGDIVVFSKPAYYLPNFNHPNRFNFPNIDAALQQMRSPSLPDVGPFTGRDAKGAWWWSWRQMGLHQGHLPNSVFGDFSNRSVFILSGPGVRQGIKRDRPINLVDVAPTLAHLLGIPAPAQCEGAARYEFLI
mgnify:CR=1 FL=1